MPARSVHTFRPAVLELEDRRTPATLVVNALTDTGTGAADAGDLRYCVAQANSRSGADTITFDPAVFGSAATITLTSGTQLLLSDTTGSTTITGPAAGVTVSGNNGTRVLQVAGSVTASLTRVSITGGKVSGSGASGSGGGIFNFGNLSLTDCRVADNFANALGSGIFNNFGSLSLSQCVVSGNTGSGGGIYNRYGTANLQDCTLSGNSGSGLTNASSGATLTNCTIAGNASAGIFNPAGTLTLRNCTLTGNTGALSNRYGSATLTNCTVTGNTSTQGGIYNLGTLTLNNVIVAGNFHPSGSALDITGTENLSGSHNLIGPGGAGGFTNGTAGNIVLAAGDFVGLGAFGDYGGPVGTIPLLPGSPALNAGTGAGTPATDARGKGRVGGTDIGAFESQGFTLAVAGGDGQITAVGTPFADPLTVAVTPNAVGEPVDGGRVTFTPPGTGAGATLTGNPATITAGAAGVTATAKATPGVFGVTATGVGANTVTFTLTAGTVPAITSAAAATFRVGTAGSFPVTATGFPDPAVTVTGTLPAGVTFNPGTKTLAGTPTQAGTFALTVTAANGVTPAATQAFTLTVNQPPAITSAAAATFRVGSAGSFLVTATGFPEPTVTVTGTLPTGVTFDPATKTLGGTPTESGLFSVTVTATNGVTPAATQAFTLTVTRPPAITSAAAATFRVGTAGSFPVTATGFPEPTVTVTGTLPTGVTFDPATKTLAGTPTQAGTFALTVTAANGVTPAATQAFTLTVNQAPVFTTPATATFVLGTAGAFRVAATGFPTPTVGVTGSLPPGVTFADTGSGTGTLAGTVTRPGRYTVTLVARNGVGPDATQAFTLVVPGVDQNAVDRYATTGGPGGGEVRQPDGSVVATLPPVAGGRAAVADVTGDGVPDTVLVSAPGTRVTVTVVDGRTGAVAATFPAFEDTFTGGAFVAAADITGDFRADIAVSADSSGGARVTVFDGGLGDVIADFFGIDDPNFRGGARVAFGDVNGDGTPDLVVAAGTGGGPRVAVYDGTTVPVRLGFVRPLRVVPDFFAFEQTLRNGVYVAAGDVTGDGFADLIFGGGPGGGPRVRVADGRALFVAGDVTNLDAPGAAGFTVVNFFADTPLFTRGVRVAAKDLDGDVLADIVTGVPTDTGSTVRTYPGSGLTLPRPLPRTSVDLLPGVLGGVFVG